MNAVVATELEAKATLPTASEADANRVLARASGLTIDSDEDYVIAADFANDCKSAGEAEDATRVKLKKKFLDGCRDIDEYFRGPIALYDKAFKAVKAHMNAYDARKAEAARVEQQRKDAERRAAEAEQQRLEQETANRIAAEQEARRQAQATADAEARARTEAAEAEARRQTALREAAEAKSRDDHAAANAANQRAIIAEDNARQATERAKTEREAAIEARRKQLKAEAQTAAAVQTMDAGAQAVTQATAAALEERAAPVKVSGVARKTLWKWKLKDGAKLADVPRKLLIIDKEYVQSVVDKVKDKGLAEELLGSCFEVWSEADLAVGKKR